VEPETIEQECQKCKGYAEALALFGVPETLEEDEGDD
jgi:hypothetical protein